uniref:Ubiquinone biosynthesis protein COQ4 homolog, mitochondrial n=1 Tax=Clastoptera arizonana TaxID=38151 RepID=A0A1B6DL62_9HEMI
MIITTRPFYLLFIKSLGIKRCCSTKYEPTYIPTTFFQKSVLSLGSSIGMLLDPTRADMLSTLGEVTGHSALQFMAEKIIQNPEGQEILREKPRINTKTVDISFLQSLPEDTLGKTYYNFLNVNNVTPDSRMDVQFIEDVELAYIMQRYREAHDLIHAILGQPTNMLGEVTVKWVEAFQTRLPMCLGGAIFGAVRLRPKQRHQYVTKKSTMGY